MKTTFLDRMIMQIAPTSGLKRIQARAAADVAMNYDAGRPTRRTASWSAPRSSADAASGMGQRDYLRWLARDFVRNRPFAQRGVSVITNNVVGSGVAISARGDDADVDRVMGLKRRHLDTTAIDANGALNISQMQRVGMSAAVQDGEVFFRRRWRSGAYSAGLPLPFQVEMLEADFLDDRVTSWGGNEVIDGVEYGPTGSVVAYHFFRQHPGTASTRVNIESSRVSAVDVIHLRRIDRPGQTRGVSWFAPVILTLGDLADYQEGEIIKQKVAALLAGFIESDPVDDATGTNAEDRADAHGFGEMGPGTIMQLDPGQRMSFTSPPLVNSYDQFTRQHLAAIAMGLGITYESLSGDLSRVNFSSARMGRIEMNRNVETWQSELVIGQLCEGIGRWFRDAIALVDAGLASRPWSLQYTAQRPVLVDPTREIPAIVNKVESGLSSMQREQRALGLDPDQIAEERAQDAKRNQPKGIEDEPTD
jgi:lambda family phage portal protein